MPEINAPQPQISGGQAEQSASSIVNTPVQDNKVAEALKKSKDKRVDSQALHETVDKVSGSASEPEKKEEDNSWKQIGQAAAWVSSGMHALAGIASMGAVFKPEVKDALNKAALLVTKATSLSTGMLGVKLLKEKRTIDAIGRFADPALVLGAKLQDMFLFKGISSALVMLNWAHEVRSGEKINHSSHATCLKDHMKFGKTVFKEIIEGGIPGLSEKSKLFNPKKDKGHTLALAGYLSMAGSLVGATMARGKRNALNRCATVIRGLGSAAADFGLMMGGTHNEVVCGTLFIINAAVDIMQKFVPEQYSDILNNFNMILYNVGNYFNARISNDKVQDEKVIKTEIAEHPHADQDKKVIDFAKAKEEMQTLEAKAA